MRILITGAAGMLGLDVRRAAEHAGHETVSLARAELDVTDRTAVAEAVSEAGPEVVINCAAWTNVDGAESEPEPAAAVNGAGAGNVARRGSAAGAWIVHVSTDYVFSGDKRHAIRGVRSARRCPPTAAPSSTASRRSPQRPPSGTRSSARAWLFGAGGQLLSQDDPARRGARRPELKVVADQVGCPTFTGHLAEALVALAAQRTPGILHVAGGGQCSWYEFARRHRGGGRR